jgi:hypothetical protein
MRTTRKDVEGMFSRFVAAMPVPHNGEHYVLSYEPAQGGYVVLLTAGKGMSDPFGPSRSRATEMYYKLNAMALVAERCQHAASG